MADCSETSFNSYSFSFQWKVHNLGARLSNPAKLTSPKFSSPVDARPLTKWQLSVFLHDDERRVQQALKRSSDDLSDHVVRYLGVEVTRVTTTTYGSDEPEDQVEEAALWSEVQLKPPAILDSMGSFMPIGPGQGQTTSLGPTKLWVSRLSWQIGNLCFKHFLPLSQLSGSQCVIFDCQIKVWFLDDPVHEVHSSLSLPDPSTQCDFNLCKIMEEARRNGLFTDVTLAVAEGKEFKAHKVVLAAQSHFFKTRFEDRWSLGASQQGIGHCHSDRIEMPDVPAKVMESILSYVYTGSVTNIDQMAVETLSAAEEYGLEGLRRICEASLSKKLTSTNAIEMLIFADDNNAVKLRAACVKYIASYASSVKNSEGWNKLKEPDIHQRFGFELLEAIANRI